MTTKGTFKLSKLFGRKSKRLSTTDEKVEIKTADDDVVLHLNETQLVFSKGSWSRGPDDNKGEVSSSTQARLDDARERNAKLKFKVSLLTDKVTVASLDADVIADKEIPAQQAKLDELVTREGKILEIVESD